MKHRIRTAALIRNDESILLVKHVHPKTQFTLWVPPGGKVEKEDKNIFAAAKREVWEETGLNVKVHEEIKYIREFFDEEDNTLNLEIFVPADLIDGDLTINNIYGRGRDENYIKSARWIKKEQAAKLAIFPELIKEETFWAEEETKTTKYLGRQNG